MEAQRAILRSLIAAVRRRRRSKESGRRRRRREEEEESSFIANAVDEEDSERDRAILVLHGRLSPFSGFFFWAISGTFPRLCGIPRRSGPSPGAAGHPPARGSDQARTRSCEDLIRRATEEEEEE